MRKTAFALLALVLCTVAFAWPVIGSEGVEPQDLAVAPAIVVEPSEMPTETESEAVALVLEDFLISTDLLFSPSPSWNCNGCVEPSFCQTHADCGYPQGYCIQNSCRCICDPDV